MNTITVKIKLGGVYASVTSKYDPINHVMVEVGMLTRFKPTSQELQQVKNEALPQLKRMLQKGGFTYDPTLWKYSTRSTDKLCELFATITFTDTYSYYAKSQFMQMIRNTGILNLPGAFVLRSR